jgi:RNase P subunit RPR2
MLSRARLKNAARMDQRLCKQCETFLNEGLVFITEKLAAKKLSYIPPNDSDFPLSPFSTVSGRAASPVAALPEPSKTKTRSQPAPRAASAVEKEVFYYQSLSVERQIEGFVKGLEAAGMDRRRLNRNAETAINNLLQIAQTLAGQRLQSQSNKVSRADIRRMGRHVDDTALMVKEYIAAVSEESLESRSTS